MVAVFVLVGLIVKHSGKWTIVENNSSKSPKECDAYLNFPSKFWASEQVSPLNTEGKMMKSFSPN